MSDPVLLEIDGRVATVTLNAPEKRNAMSPEMTEAFPRVLQEVAQADDVRAVIVTGTGSAFCAGGDLGFLHSGEPDVVTIREKMTGFYPRYLSLLDLDIPTVAAVNGPAIGAGFCLALMCDLRIASTDAPMSMPFVRIGIHPGMAATALLSRVVGQTTAADLLYTGRAVRGEEAERLGIVNRAVPPNEVMTAARDLAEQVAVNAPIALRYVKQGLRAAFRRELDQATAWEGFAQPVTMATDDVREGLAAVRERRDPHFRGR
ncbi:MAG TPA: enoyl-CoA hydratase/isomerase family protein [Actinomycetota bacterium]|nr:enoyl-CoA hydratase/isomerase family protein [Actinomycetota bacterium]